LMLTATTADLALSKENLLRQCADLVGHPSVAMLLALLFSFYSFGFARGFDREQVLKFSNDCLAPVASMLLVVGAGGGFSKVLEPSAAGRAIAGWPEASQPTPCLRGWLVAPRFPAPPGSPPVAT